MKDLKKQHEQDYGSPSQPRKAASQPLMKPSKKRKAEKPASQVNQDDAKRRKKIYSQKALADARRAEEKRQATQASNQLSLPGAAQPPMRSMASNNNNNNTDNTTNSINGTTDNTKDFASLSQGSGKLTSAVNRDDVNKLRTQRPQIPSNREPTAPSQTPSVTYSAPIIPNAAAQVQVASQPLNLLLKQVKNNDNNHNNNNNDNISVSTATNLNLPTIGSGSNVSSAISVSSAEDNKSTVDLEEQGKTLVDSVCAALEHGATLDSEEFVGMRDKLFKWVTRARLHLKFIESKTSQARFKTLITKSMGEVDRVNEILDGRMKAAKEEKAKKAAKTAKAGKNGKAPNIMDEIDAIAKRWIARQEAKAKEARELEIARYEQLLIVAKETLPKIKGPNKHEVERQRKKLVQKIETTEEILKHLKAEDEEHSEREFTPDGSKILMKLKDGILESEQTPLISARTQKRRSNTSTNTNTNSNNNDNNDDCEFEYVDQPTYESSKLEEKSDRYTNVHLSQPLLAEHNKQHPPTQSLTPKHKGRKSIVIVKKTLKSTNSKNNDDKNSERMRGADLGRILGVGDSYNNRNNNNNNNNYQFNNGTNGRRRFGGDLSYILGVGDDNDNTNSNNSAASESEDENVPKEDPLPELPCPWIRGPKLNDNIIENKINKSLLWDDGERNGVVTLDVLYAYDNTCLDYTSQTFAARKPHENVCCIICCIICYVCVMYYILCVCYVWCLYYIHLYY